MKKIIIKEKNSGERIDKFLAKEFFSYTRGEITRQIKAGSVLVNGKAVKPSYVLKENDEVVMNHESRIMNHESSNMNHETRIMNQEIVPNKNIKLEIIYQDENLIAANKPAGLQVHPDSHEKNNTLANALIAKFPEIKNVGDPSTSSGQENVRPGIVHRLDKDTSGIIVIARNQKTFEELKKKFKNREIKKIYQAIVYNTMAGEGVIDKPIARAASYRKQVIAGKKTRTKIRSAITEHKVIKTWDDFALLEVTPKTGRMHQIRVHLASIGHPIVGDKLYCSKKIKKVEVPRQLLHAQSLSFELNGQKFYFEAELPRDFKEFMANID